VTEQKASISEKSKEHPFTDMALARMKEAGLRITMPRVQVIRAIAGSHKAQTVQHIYERIVTDGGRTDLVSVYRTLQTLIQLHLVHHIGSVDGFHPCRSCGNVEEICSHRHGQNLDELGPLGDFVPESYRIEVLGTCGACRQLP
jgi:Fe2+ or Zn2+ uptake regulation protein